SIPDPSKCHTIFSGKDGNNCPWPSDLLPLFPLQDRSAGNQVGRRHLPLFVRLSRNDRSSRIIASLYQTSPRRRTTGTTDSMQLESGAARTIDGTSARTRE